MPRPFPRMVPPGPHPLRCPWPRPTKAGLPCSDTPANNNKRPLMRQFPPCHAPRTLSPAPGGFLPDTPIAAQEERNP